MKNSKDYFYVNTSRIHGQGLFAKRAIPENACFFVDTCRPTRTTSSHAPNTYVLNYYLTAQNKISSCIANNQIRQVQSIWHELHQDMCTPLFVRCRDMFMHANDLAWPSKDEYEYDSSDQNKIEWILVLSDMYPRKIIGVAARVLQPIALHEECGVSYGFDFWSS
jgi:hypothetical protein